MLASRQPVHFETNLHPQPPTILRKANPSGLRAKGPGKEIRVHQVQHPLYPNTWHLYLMLEDPLLLTPAPSPPILFRLMIVRFALPLQAVGYEITVLDAPPPLRIVGRDSPRPIEIGMLAIRKSESRNLQGPPLQGGGVRLVQVEGPIEF